MCIAIPRGKKAIYDARLLLSFSRFSSDDSDPRRARRPRRAEQRAQPHVRGQGGVRGGGRGRRQRQRRRGRQGQAQALLVQGWKGDLEKEGVHISTNIDVMCALQNK